MPHGDLLGEFAEAVLGEDDDRLTRSRDHLLATLGPEVLVDAAGAVASFNAVVKVADGSGIVIEDHKIAAAEQMSDILGEDYSAHLARYR